MITIDDDVYAYNEAGSYSNETVVVTSPRPTSEVVDALGRAGERFMAVDENGAEGVEYDGTAYTPNYCSDPSVEPAGVVMYLDCKGVIEDAMVVTLKRVLSEELQPLGDAHVAVYRP